VASSHPGPADLRVDGPGPDGRSLSALLKDFAEGGADLVRYEFRLAKTEAARWRATSAPAPPRSPSAACSDSLGP
jgi:hypothetical protein